MYWEPRLTPLVQCMQCSRHLWMGPIKTARSLACPPPACLKPCLMFCQATSEALSFQLLIKGGSFITSWMVIDYLLLKTVVAVKFLPLSWLSEFIIIISVLFVIYLYFVQGRPTQIFPLAGTHCHLDTTRKIEMVVCN